MKRKILIASFLKPVNDIRSYEKMALSIAKNKGYKVYSTGYPSNSTPTDPNIVFIPLKPFRKNGLSRIIARLQVFKIYLKLKPELIIVNSPDLLTITCINKILFGTKIIYDIQENYFRNLWHQTNYPIGLRHFLAIVIRLKELITSPLFNHFFLAEKVYARQLKFIGNRYTILENKSKISTKLESKSQLNKSIMFLISGTISREYGVFKGLYFFEFARKIMPNARLKILGHCPNKNTFIQLTQQTKGDAGIELIISKTPVPHTIILEAIQEANYGLLPYLPNKSTEGKWPTKLYEYMANELPFLIQTNPVWNDFIIQAGVGLTLDFKNLTEDICIRTVQTLNASSYYYKPLPSNIFWDNEEPKLIGQIRHILN